MNNRDQWLSAYDARGRQYFYHRKTRVTQWTNPTTLVVKVDDDNDDNDDDDNVMNNSNHDARQNNNINNNNNSNNNINNKDDDDGDDDDDDAISDANSVGQESPHRLINEPIQYDEEANIAIDSSPIQHIVSPDKQFHQPIQSCRSASLDSLTSNAIEIKNGLRTYTKLKRIPASSTTRRATYVTSSSSSSSTLDNLNSICVDSTNTRVSPDQWIECQEVKTKRTLFYNSTTKSIVFDERPILQKLGPAYSYVHRDSVTSGLDSALRKHESSQGSESSFELATKNRSTVQVEPFVPESIMRLSSVQSVVTDLLSTHQLPWNFNNAVVQYFRASMKTLRLKQYLPDCKALAFPRYFSNEPVDEPRTIVCSVKLPEIHYAMSHTKINCSPNDTADTLIKKASKKCSKSQHDGSSICVLKACGREEFLFGDKTVFDFEFIRHCVRHQQEIRLSLISGSEIEQRIANVQKEMDADLKVRCYPKVIDDIEVISRWHHEQALRTDIPFRDIRVLPIERVKVPLHFQVVELNNIELCPRYDLSIYAICVEMMLLHGSHILNTTILRTRFRRAKEGLRYLHEVIVPSSEMSSLPRGTTLVFLVYGVKVESKEVLLAYVKCPLIQYNNTLVTGLKRLPMWMLNTVNTQKPLFDAADLSRCSPSINLSVAEAPTLFIRFDEFLLPVIGSSFSNPIDVTDAQVGVPVSLASLSPKIRKHIDSIIQRDSLAELTDEERNILWMTRHNFISDFSVLPKLLRCVDWSCPYKSAEACRMMQSWARPPSALCALELLDVRYADHRVREYAVDLLDELVDSELHNVLLQLVQVLKFEVWHDSPIARFLLRRGIANPFQIGHYLFWHLKAELHNPDFCERFALLMECYLVHFRWHARQLQSQNIIIQRLLTIASKIVTLKTVDKLDSESCKLHLREELRSLNTSFPAKWQISLDPKLQVSGLRPQECKYMSSKKLPLWLSFENSDPEGEPILVIFKTGDDLRQDLLTLQLFRVMDRVWRQEGQDMQLRPYGCVATGVNNDGEGVGMIEVVTQANTLSNIQIDEGGGALGALKNGTLVKYLQKHNPSPEEYSTAVRTFSATCAGYCVATFCLGIGDRHNDNIMLSRDGHLFHIDFGHFLGNFKSKYGFNRERAPFVFTPEMAQVMGGIGNARYTNFKNQCAIIFNLLRKQASLFFSLFTLMLSAGMPELSTAKDIDYLRARLLLRLSDKDASKMFKKEIKTSVGDFYRRVDNTIHNFKHNK